MRERKKKLRFALSKVIYDKATIKQDVVAAGGALQALFRGEDNPEAQAGGMLLGAAIISLFASPKKGGGKGAK